MTDLIGARQSLEGIICVGRGVELAIRSGCQSPIWIVVIVFVDAPPGNSVDSAVGIKNPVNDYVILRYISGLPCFGDDVSGIIKLIGLPLVGSVKVRLPRLGSRYPGFGSVEPPGVVIRELGNYFLPRFIVENNSFNIANGQILPCRPLE